MERSQEVVGPDHPQTLKAQANYALTLRKLKDYERAEAVYLEVVLRREEVLGVTHQDTLRVKL